QVSLLLEAALDNAGHIAAGTRLDAAVQLLLGQRRQTGQRTVDLARALVEGEQGFQLVLEAVALLPFGGELEPDRLRILADLADDACLRQFLAGPGEGVSRRQLASHGLLQTGIAQGIDQVEVLDLDAGAGPGDDLSQQTRTGGDGNWDTVRGVQGHGVRNSCVRVRRGVQRKKATAARSSVRRSGLLGELGSGQRDRTRSTPASPTESD